jgi:hypothetical protein
MNILRVNNSTYKYFRDIHKHSSGIYIWYEGNKCIYVGASVNVGKRSTRIFSSRKYTYNKENIQIFIILCNERRLPRLEKLLFDVLNPLCVERFNYYLHKVIRRKK